MESHVRKLGTTLTVYLTLVAFQYVDCIRTYSLQNYCGDEVSMILSSVYQLKVSTDGWTSGTNPCEITVEAWYTWPKLMFYFEDFNLACSDGHLEFFDGSSGNDHIVGLSNNECGPFKASGVFTTDTRTLRIRFVKRASSSSNQLFSIIVTAFEDDGGCPSYAYQCDNGRCIDDTLNCNGYNSCGDHSDCTLGAGVIAGIVIGSLFVLAVIIGGIVFVICCIKSNKRSQAARSPGQVLYTANTNVTSGVQIGQQPVRNMNGPAVYPTVTQPQTY